MSVITPVSTQIANSQPDEPTSRAMSAETMKMPEPIMVPTTSMVASNRPIFCRNAGAGSPVVGPSCGVAVRLMNSLHPLEMRKLLESRRHFSQLAVPVAIAEVNHNADGHPNDQAFPGLRRQGNHLGQT